MVAAMSPPCTSLVGWGPLNASRGSERHAWNRERSLRIGTVCDSVAYAQVAGGRHYLTDSTHEHGRTEGAEARATQLRTWERASRVAAGISSLFRMLESSRRLISTTSATVDGIVVSRRGRTRIREPKPKGGWGCKACRGGIEMQDMRHTRAEEGPVKCRYPEILPIEWAGEGCQAHSQEPEAQTSEPGICRHERVKSRVGASRARSGAQDAREPRLPSADGTDAYV